MSVIEKSIYKLIKNNTLIYPDNVQNTQKLCMFLFRKLDTKCVSYIGQLLDNNINTLDILNWIYDHNPATYEIKRIVKDENRPFISCFYTYLPLCCFPYTIVTVINVGNEIHKVLKQEVDRIISKIEGKNIEKALKKEKQREERKEELYNLKNEIVREVVQQLKNNTPL